MRELLGGKGANLAEMTNLGFPVPPGFTISTKACLLYYEQKRRFPPGLLEEIRRALRRLEQAMGKRFGDAKNPLLVSVRSGAAVSMPGMMDTILNLGLNDRTVLGLMQRSGNPRFAFDAYRRFIQMYGNVVLHVDHGEFERLIVEQKRDHHVTSDTELNEEALKELVREFKQLIRRETGHEFPEEPMDQLTGAIEAVFASWNNERAITYRNLHHIPHTLGTAVNVQAMVFGNLGNDSGTGVLFTRDPRTGERLLYGEFLMNAQGEDVVAGIRTPQSIDQLKQVQPKVYTQLVALAGRLERHYRNMQDIEFTVEAGTLYLLQTRSGARTGQAAVRIAVEMVKERLISQETALLRVDPMQLDQLLHPTIDPKVKLPVIAKGLPASPGAAVGVAVFDAHDAIRLAEDGKPVVLVRAETSPEDVGGMAAAQGILTARGGYTCVGGTTWLLTPEGFVTAEELFSAVQQGEKPFLLAFSHRSMKSCWRRVIATGRRRSETVWVNFSQTGRSLRNRLEMTLDHKMFTVFQRRLTKKPLVECLEDRDVFCVVDHVPSGSSAPQLPDLDPYLVGTLFTDGSIAVDRRRGRVIFTQRATTEKAAMIAAVQRSFRESFGMELSHHAHKVSRGVFQGRTIVGEAEDFACFRRGPAEELQRVRQSLVPWVLSLPTEDHLMRFLAGVIDGDGSYGPGRIQIYIGKEFLLAGVVLACLRLGIYPQVTRNRSIAHVQIVEYLEEILSRTQRVKGQVDHRHYGSKLFSVRSLFDDLVNTIDRRGRLRSAVQRNVLYSDSLIRSDVLPRCPEGLQRQIESLLVSDLRMIRGIPRKGQETTWVYNFEVLAEDELDKNFVAFTQQYTGVLVSNSHAAVVGRGMGKPCIVGCTEIAVDERRRAFSANGQRIREGEFITLDGTTGAVMRGQAKLVEPTLAGEFRTLMRWADARRRLKVRTNADTPHDAVVARQFGAEGIGLCRTEHMFFGPDRLPHVRAMILAKETAERERALAKLLPMQRSDFKGIFKAMKGLPVTIRLLDPPLHEFIPHTDDEIRRVASQLNVPAEEIRAKAEALKEFNPMLGHRGCRLGLTFPEINVMQARAIFEAACELRRQGQRVIPEVMVPLVGHVNELKIARATIVEVAEQVMRRFKVKIPYLVGTMIEVPRAALTAEAIAQEAEFFSFGTNDLTQMTFGFSRDDAGKFLPSYLEQGILERDPFVTLDQSGVGQLIEIAVKAGRSVRTTLKVGICGEHGGDPASVEFCHRAMLDYVSCSPYRVPIARLAAAHAVIREPRG